MEGVDRDTVYQLVALLMRVGGAIVYCVSTGGSVHVGRWCYYLLFTILSANMKWKRCWFLESATCSEI